MAIGGPVVFLLDLEIVGCCQQGVVTNVLHRKASRNPEISLFMVNFALPAVATHSVGTGSVCVYGHMCMCVGIEREKDA